MSHAKLSASGSTTWLLCPGSIAAQADHRDEGSVFAAEGTLAHLVASTALSQDSTAADAFDAVASSNDPEAKAVIAQLGDVARLRGEMVEHVDGYLAFVRSLKGSPFIETRLEYTDWVADGYGTADALIVDGNRATVIDLKYGRGKRVDVDTSTQLPIYALGALQAVRPFATVTEVEVIVYQPRIGNIARRLLTLDELTRFGEWVRERAKATESHDAPRVPGEEQCFWCKARFTCAERAQANLDAIPMIDERPADSRDLTLAQLVEISERFDEIERWMSDVRAHLFKQANSGVDVPGRKLVEGRSVRRWLSDESALRALIEAGVPPDEAAVVSPITITDAERRLGKKHPIFTTATHKPPGKLALVPLSDPRPAAAPTMSIEHIEE